MRARDYAGSRFARAWRLGLGGLAVEGGAQAAADRRLAAGIGDLVADEIGHIEDVDGALAEGDDMRRGDVEIEVGDRPRQVVEQAGTVEAGRLDGGELVRPGVVDEDAGLQRERAKAGAALRPCAATISGSRTAPDSACSMRSPTRRARRNLVGLVVELAVDEDGIERPAVGGGEDLGVDDVGAGGGAGAGDDRQQPRMVGGEDGDLGDALEGMGGGGGGERAPGLVGVADERGVGELVGQIDAQPVGRIVALEVGGALALRPVGERLGEFVLGHGDALVAADLAVAAGDHGLGLVVERAQELALPAVPDAGADRLDVGDGEHQQHPQPLHRLHDGGEIEDGLAVVEVARLGGDAHGQVLLDQPGDGLGLRLVEAEARAKAAGDAGAGDGMILRPALGDVVEAAWRHRARRGPGCRA